MLRADTRLEDMLQDATRQTDEVVRTSAEHGYQIKLNEKYIGEHDEKLKQLRDLTQELDRKVAIEVV